MAERTMLRLGDFDFEIATAAYQKYVAKHGAKWAEQERLGRDPALQFVGRSTTEITLDATVYPAVAGSREASLIPLRRMLAEARPHQMVTGVGDVCGLWVLAEVSDTRTFFTDDGEARKIELSLALKYYGPDSEQRGSLNRASPPASGGIKGRTENFDVAIPDITPESPLPQIRSVAELVRGIVRETVAVASEVSSSGILWQTAQNLADLNAFVDDSLSAVASMGTGTDARPVLMALKRGIQHVHDTARLTGYAAAPAVVELERTASAFFAVPGTGREATARNCQQQAEAGRRLQHTCKTTCRRTSALLAAIKLEAP